MLLLFTMLFSIAFIVGICCVVTGFGMVAGRTKYADIPSAERETKGWCYLLTGFLLVLGIPLLFVFAV